MMPEKNQTEQTHTETTATPQVKPEDKTLPQQPGQGELAELSEAELDKAAGGILGSQEFFRS
jgi:hypothetical protein